MSRQLEVGTPRGEPADSRLALLPVDGVRVGTACAGINRRDREDVAVIEIAEGSICAAVFTRNRFSAAPVELARAHLRRGRPRFLLINSGNANAGTGPRGREDAFRTCRTLAECARCPTEAVLPFSTGLIGEPLPTDLIDAAIPEAYRALSPHGWLKGAQAIMTTDTCAKGASTTVDILGHPIAITGIAKGAGMIQPDMATMLAFIATNAAISPAALESCLRSAVDKTFNRITVDGDTSTNDACVLMATGKVALPLIEDVTSPAFRGLANAVTEVCARLAQAIVRDGEGATKFICVEVGGGNSEGECLRVARAVANSPLVKTAFFASDPNWGRILAAVGRAGIPDLDVARVSVHLDDLCIVRQGARAEDYTEAQGRRVMAQPDITVRVDLGRGLESGTVWTCDLSYDYVRINAEYRT